VKVNVVTFSHLGWSILFHKSEGAPAFLAGFVHLASRKYSGSVAVVCRLLIWANWSARRLAYTCAHKLLKIRCLYESRLAISRMS